jgi:hypothetical protein
VLFSLCAGSTQEITKHETELAELLSPSVPVPSSQFPEIEPDLEAGLD